LNFQSNVNKLNKKQHIKSKNNYFSQLCKSYIKMYIKVTKKAQKQYMLRKSPEMLIVNERD